jgi:hypothetical protein
MLGKKGVSIPEYPPEKSTCTLGDISIRQRSGNQTFGPKLACFIMLAEIYWNLIDMDSGKFKNNR